MSIRLWNRNHSKTVGNHIGSGSGSYNTKPIGTGFGFGSQFLESLNRWVPAVTGSSIFLNKNIYMVLIFNRLKLKLLFYFLRLHTYTYTLMTTFFS